MLQDQLTTAVAVNKFVISRQYNSPIEKVFEAWSTAGAMAAWWGPKGMDLSVASFEFAPGGTFHYSMKAPDGNLMWGKFVFEAINAPHEIMFTNSFSDENGSITKAPFGFAWPLEILNRVTFSERKE